MKDLRGALAIRKAAASRRTPRGLQPSKECSEFRRGSRWVFEAMTLDLCGFGVQNSGISRWIFGSLQT